MSSVEVESVFDIEEEHNPYTYTSNSGNNDNSTEIPKIPTNSPKKFLNNLAVDQDQPQPNSTISSSKASEFMPAISPSLMLSSMANSSPAAENILSSAKERINEIRSWKDFFALDQFRIPESSTAAQSRASHNFTHFQNNYLVILLLFTGFSL